ncbi:MAG: hypothetical protein ACXACY_27410 [Candidatus Hodarchaeales archaeon]|jgi:hypothetical protein
MNKREYAKQLLKHYFKISINGPDADMLDIYAEIEDIVDLIVDAAIEEIKEELEDYFQGLVKEK